MTYGCIYHYETINICAAGLVLQFPIYPLYHMLIRVFSVKMIFMVYSSLLDYNESALVP